MCLLLGEVTRLDHFPRAYVVLLLGEVTRIDHFPRAHVYICLSVYYDNVFEFIAQ